MSPVRLFFHSLRILRRVSLSPSSGGRRPRSWLDWSPMEVRLVQELMLAGISPEKALLLRLSVSRRRRRPRLAGTAPLNLLEPGSRTVSDDRLPTAGERTPLRPREGRLSTTTRRGWPWHLQNPPVLLAFHEGST
ncbi:hypothetical protein PAHAL_1G183800 [Panicum hallii]|uniref:Uncharacterized protein n=1 Tax=Panicum hallii TaxID=206008 RepID=A0A2T8KVN6_9POAL|nr:hypothetical protein PAHAL_1G183800 [Panicum hallii]